MEAELKALEAALGQPKRPVVAVVGGALFVAWYLRKQRQHRRVRRM